MSIKTTELFVNVHVELLRDLGGSDADCTTIKHLYESEGILSMIKSCKETYTRITQEGLSSLDNPNNRLEWLLSKLQDYNALVFVTFPLRFTISSVLDERVDNEAVTCYNSTVSNYDATAASFQKLQSEIRKRDLCGYPRWLISDIRYWLEKLLKGYCPVGVGAIPPGACVGASSSVVDRISDIYKATPDWYYLDTDADHWNKMANVRHNVARACIVPKDSFGGRLITPDGLVRQYYARPLMRGLVDCCLRAEALGIIINIKDQTRNQMAALIGSEGYDWCTIDHHAASDSWSAQLVREVWPTDIVDIFRFLPTDYRYNYQENRLYSFSPSGNVLTFVCESLLHSALALCAISYVEIFSDSRITTFDGVYNMLKRNGKNHPILYFYGDDGILKEKYFQTYRDLAEMIGLVVNSDKSFYSNDYLFRESCGSFFYCGSPIDLLIRWPRKGMPEELSGGIQRISRLDEPDESFVTKTQTVMETLISLQNGLWDRGYYSAADVLSSKLGELGISTIKPVGYVSSAVKCCYGFSFSHVQYFTLGEIITYRYEKTQQRLLKSRVTALYNVVDNICGYRPERLVVNEAYETVIRESRIQDSETLLYPDGFRVQRSNQTPTARLGSKVIEQYAYNREIRYKNLRELKEALIGRGFRYGDKVIVTACVAQPQTKVVACTGEDIDSNYLEDAAYAYYLEHGPQYEDELSKVLHVTSPLKWRYGYQMTVGVRPCRVELTIII